MHCFDCAITRLGNLLSGPNITGRAKDYEFFFRRIACAQDERNSKAINYY